MTHSPKQSSLIQNLKGFRLPYSPWKKYLWFFAACLALGHFIFAALYSNVIPYRQPGLTQSKVLPDIGAPDERAHANLIQEIITTGKHPVFTPDRPDFALNYQAHQPPLYYRLNATLLNLTNQPSVSTQNAGQTMRLFNCLLGALNIFATVALARFLTGNARIALGAAAVIAFIPMNLSLSASINNDVLLFALITSTWALAAASRLHPHRWYLLIIAGILGGLALLTKTSGLIALPIAALIALWPTTKRLSPSPEQLSLTFAALAIAIAIAIPLWTQNISTYGEPFLTQTFSQAFPPDFTEKRFETPTKTYLWLSRLVHNTQDSATGVFGYFDIHYPEQIPIILKWPVLIAAAIGLAALISDRRYATTSIALLGITLFLVAYISFNTRYAQPQARYLFPGLPLLAILIGAGLQRLTPHITALWIAVVLAFNAYTLPWLHDEFQTRVNPPQETLNKMNPQFRSQILRELEFYRNLP